MFSAPVIATVAPRELPTAIVIVAIPSCLWVATRDKASLHRGAMPWLLAGIVPGTMVGLTIIRFIDLKELSILVGAATIIGVGVSMKRRRLRITPLSTVAAATLANVFGTASGISGAPVAILFQNQGGAANRATLGLFFSASATFSLLGYLFLGTAHLYQGAFALLLLPAMAAGVLLSKSLHRLVDAKWWRPCALSLTAAAGLTAILHVFT